MNNDSKPVSRHIFSRVFVLTAVISSGTVLVNNIAVAAPPKDCNARLDDLVLPSFAAYNVDLKSFHVDELKNIAPTAKAILTSGGFVYIDGYGVFFKTCDPALENSINRARNVRRELINQLKAIGVKGGFSRIIAEGRGDSSNIEVSTTKRQRWFLRRVELSFEHQKRPDVDDPPV